MQKPRNSESIVIQPVQYATAALALLGLLLSCPLPAQDAGNTQSVKAAIAKKTLAKPAGAGNAKAALERNVAEQNHPDAQQDGDLKKDAYIADLATVTQVTMEQSIESARKRKLRDLAEAVRAQLEGKSQAATPAPAVDDTILTVEKLPEAVVLNAAPRLWSLTANGNRVWAEVLIKGRIVQLDSLDGQLVQLDSDARAPALGSWTALSLTADGLVLGRPINTSGKKSKQSVRQERMLLRAPARGISVMTYKFAAPGSAEADDLLDSAQRAARLPLASGAQR